MNERNTCASYIEPSKPRCSVPVKVAAEVQGGQGRVGPERLAQPLLRGGAERTLVERFDRRGTEPFELFR